MRRSARTPSWATTLCAASLAARRSASPLVGPNTAAHLLATCSSAHKLCRLPCPAGGQGDGPTLSTSAGEMCVGPKNVFFLDEISTGLDSSTTYLIVKAIRNMVHMAQVRAAATWDHTVHGSLLSDEATRCFVLCSASLCSDAFWCCPALRAGLFAGHLPHGLAAARARGVRHL